MEVSSLPTLPLAALLGIEIVEAAQEGVVATMSVRDDVCTAGHVLHGGALMALADTLGAIGTWLNLPEGARTATLESKTNFLGQATAGSVVRAEATPVHIGKRTSVWQTRVYDELGRLIGLVTQTQMVLSS